MKTTLKILTILSLCSTIAGAATGDNAGYAGAFLRMGLGARAAGMGNSGVAYSENGFAAYYNPGAVPYLEARYLSLTYYFLSLDRQLHYTGFALPLKPTAGISVAWLHGGVSDIQGRNFSGEPDEIYDTGEDVFILTFANAFHRLFSIGVNFKILQHQLLDIKGTGLGFDIGVLVKPFDNIALGIQLKDISSSYTWNTQKLFDEKGGNYTEYFPQILKVGLALKYRDSFVFSGDLEASDQEDYRVHFGGEYLYRETLYLRLGMDNNHPTFGAGLAYGFVANLDTQLDYCVLFGVAGEGNTHVFSWEFKF